MNVKQQSNQPPNLLSMEQQEQQDNQLICIMNFKQASHNAAQLINEQHFAKLKFFSKLLRVSKNTAHIYSHNYKNKFRYG